MSASTWATILGVVLAILTQLTATELDALWPGHGTQLAIYVGIAILGFTQIINALTKQNKGDVQTGPLAADLPIVNAAGATIGTNVSTTSTKTIAAPVNSISYVQFANPVPTTSTASNPPSEKGVI